MKIKTQSNAKDCGLSCLQAFYHFYYRKWIDIESLRQKVSFNKDGISVADLAQLSTKIGMKLDAYNVSFDEFLASNFKKKAIMLISNQGYPHYVIFLNIKNSIVTYFDPTFGKKRKTFSEFREIYRGVLIDIIKDSTNKEFVKLKTTNPIKIILENQEFIFFTIIMSLISCIFLLTSSIYIKVLFDSIIPSFKEKELLTLTIIFVLIAIFRSINSYLFSFVKVRLESKIATQLTSKLANHLSDIPIVDAEKYEISDKLKRFQAIEFISGYISNITETYFSSFLIGLTAVITIFIIDIQIAIFALIALAFVFGVTFLNQKNNFKKYKKLINIQLKYSQSIYEIASASPDYKNKDLKKLLSKNFNNQLTQIIKSKFDITNINSLFIMFKNIVIFSFPFFIYFGSTHKIFNNEMALGSMIVFATMFGFLADSINSISVSLVQYSQYKNQYHLFNSFMAIEKEKINIKGFKSKKINSIKFKNFKFGYSKFNNIIKIKDFEINKNIYLDGSNGSGKSTILKNIASFYSKENIYINGIEMKLLNLENYRDKMILISNKFFAPSIKIIDWITKQCPHQLSTLIKNLQDYKIFNMLKIYKINIINQIVNNGEQFSTGQKQIINILQLFTKKYDLILLDESFSGIDKFIRKKLIAAIFSFQKGALIIATTHNKKILPIPKVVKIDEINLS